MPEFLLKTACNYYNRVARKLPVALLALLFLAIPGTSAHALADPRLNLTAEEQQWLDSHPDIKIGIRDTPPLVMIGEKGEGYRGLSIDYVERVEKLLGIRFNLINYPTWQKLIEETKNRHVDIIVTGTITLDRASYLDFTKPYIQLHNKIIVKKELDSVQLKLADLSGKRVASVEGTAVSRHIMKNFPEIKFVATRDEIASLEAVSFGEVDAAVMEMARASFYIQQEKITNLVIAGDADYLYNFCFSSRNDWPLLNSILSKALSCISEKERRQITNKWLYDYKPSIFDNRRFWVGAGITCVVLSVLLIIAWNIVLRRKVALSTAVIREEIEQLARAESELRRLNRTLMVLGKSHELLMQFTEEISLYNAICKHLVDVGGYRSASVILGDAGIFTTVAGYFLNESEAAADIWLGVESRASSTSSQAIESEKVIRDSRTTEFSEDGGRDKVSTLAIPLWGDGNVIGALEIVSPGEDAFDSEEVSLLTELTENLAYTVIAIRLKEEHRGSEELVRKLSQAIDQSPITIVITDNYGAIEYVNPYFSKVTGYSFAEAVGNNPRILKSGIQSAEFYKLLWDTINGGFEWHGEFCNKKKNGDLYWESASISPLRNGDGDITHFIAVKEDITDRKTVFDELQKAKVEAEAATTAKSSFLANMSHEIRTPMNAVLGMIYLVQQTGLTEKQTSYISKAEGAAKSLLTIINDILDFSKIEAGRLQMESIPFLLSDVLAKITDIAPINIGRKKVELIITATPDTPDLLTGDPLRLGQVLLNLISNGIKFTEKGEVVLSVSVESLTDERVTLEFRVSDTGIGMTVDQRERLFSAFSQADTSTTRRFGGTGLGLIISRQLVQLMGGDISIESESGVGSSFSFSVRLALESDCHETLAEMFAPLQGVRLLHAGAECRGKSITGQMLSSFGIQVHPTGGAVAAKLAAAQYDLLLIETSSADESTIENLIELPGSSVMQMLPTVIYANDRTLHSMEGSGKILQTTVVKPATPTLLLRALVQAAGLAPDTTTFSAKETITVDNFFSGRRILLVEDNQINQEVARGILEKWGIQVDIAGNGALAVAALEPAHMVYDAVLMDLQMPVMDGFEATRRIRADECHKALPVIAMTASAMTEDRDRCYAAGMNDHVAKPVDVAELFAVLHRWLKPGSSLPDTILPEIAVAVTGSAFPEETPGIDLDKAVRRLGSPQILLTVLREFRRLHAEDDRIIREALEQGSLLLAQRAAHTLKGLARTIGAEEVGAVTEELESALTQSDTTATAPLLSVLSKKLGLLNQTLSFVDTLSADDFLEIDGGEKAAPADPEAVSIVMKQLAGQLAKNNLNAGDNVRKLKILLAAQPLRGQLEKLTSAVERLDFKQAATVLANLADILTISLSEES